MSIMRSNVLIKIQVNITSNIMRQPLVNFNCFDHFCIFTTFHHRLFYLIIQLQVNTYYSIENDLFLLNYKVCGQIYLGTQIDLNYSNRFLEVNKHSYQVHGHFI